jgi:dienelactone hydrolase
MTGIWFAAAIALGLILPSAASAQDKVVVPSFSPSTAPSFFSHMGPRQNINGELYLPKSASGPMPAMVVVHGSGGMMMESGQHVRDWAMLFQRWGVAALVIDGFLPRGVSETYSNQDRLPYWYDVADGLAALKLLAADPRFDRNRIGIIGFSRGGRVAVDTALESLRRAMIRDGARYALHIAFYAPGTGQLRDRATDRSPMLWLHGEADNYVPVGPAREYADWFRGMGNPVTFVAYPGAYHDFDVAGAVTGYSKLVQTARNCDSVFDIASGRVLRLDHNTNPTNDPAALLAYLKSCMTTGANMGEDSAAHAAAIDEVHAFVARNFHLPG